MQRPGSPLISDRNLRDRFTRVAVGLIKAKPVPAPLTHHEIDLVCDEIGIEHDEARRLFRRDDTDPIDNIIVYTAAMAGLARKVITARISQPVEPNAGVDRYEQRRQVVVARAVELVKTGQAPFPFTTKSCHDLHQRKLFYSRASIREYFLDAGVGGLGEMNARVGAQLTPQELYENAKLFTKPVADKVERPDSPAEVELKRRILNEGADLVERLELPLPLRHKELDLLYTEGFYTRQTISRHFHGLEPFNLGLAEVLAERHPAPQGEVIDFPEPKPVVERSTSLSIA